MGSGASKTGRGEKQENVAGGFSSRDEYTGKVDVYKAGTSAKMVNPSANKPTSITVTRTFKTSKGSFVEYSWKTASGKVKKTVTTRKRFFNTLAG